ncbi:MAG: hypothetical protein AAGG01_15995, partial [Planctomycetota bacterium]
PDRGNRYASVSELSADVGRHLASLPINAHPPSKLEAAAKFVARHQALVAAALLLAVTLIMGLTVITRQYLEAEQKRSLLSQVTAAKVIPELLLAADQLWPLKEETLPDIDRWLTRADALLNQDRAFRDALEALSKKGVLTTRDREQGEAERVQTARLELQGIRRALQFEGAMQLFRTNPHERIRALQETIEAAERGVTGGSFIRFESEEERATHDALQEVLSRLVALGTKRQEVLERRARIRGGA